MGLLKLVDNVPGIDFYEYRDTDYWNKFKYRARLNIAGARFLYYTTNLQSWKNIVSTWDNKFIQLTSTEKQRILNSENLVKSFMDLRTSFTKNKDGMVRIEGNTVAIFSNNLNLLHEIKKWDSSIDVDYTEVQVSQFSGVKYFVRDPKYNYRIYLKSKRVEKSIVDELRDFLSKHKELQASSGLKKWLRSNHRTLWKFRYSYGSHFIDFDDESMITYLGLCFGDLIGKKYKLEKREQTI